MGSYDNILLRSSPLNGRFVGENGEAVNIADLMGAIASSQPGEIYTAGGSFDLSQGTERAYYHDVITTHTIECLSLEIDYTNGPISFEVYGARNFFSSIFAWKGNNIDQRKKGGSTYQSSNTIYLASTATKDYLLSSYTGSKITDSSSEESGTVDLTNYIGFYNTGGEVAVIMNNLGSKTSKINLCDFRCRWKP